MRWQNLSSCEFEEWMLRAAWDLEQRREMIQTAGEEGLFYSHEISSTAPDTLIHKDIHHCRTVGDWHFGSRGAEFLRLPQPRVWGKVMRAFCEQSRSWLSGRGTLSHQTMKMHSFQRVSFLLQLFCLADYNLYFKANKVVVTYGSPYSLTRALWKRKVIALPHQKRWWFG